MIIVGKFVYINNSYKEIPNTIKFDENEGWNFKEISDWVKETNPIIDRIIYLQ